MNSFLLYPEKTLSGESAYPSFQDIYKDLNLNIIVKTMAQDDVVMHSQIREVMMVPIRDSSTVQYRYEIVKEFYKQKELMNTMYQLGRRGMTLAEQYKKELEQNRNKTSARAGAVIAALNFMSESLIVLKELKQAVYAKQEELHAKGLLAFCERIRSYPLEDFEQFHQQLLFYTAGGEAIFSIRMSGGLKLESSCLCSCKSYKAANRTNTSRKLLKLYYKVAKKDTILIEDEPLDRDINRFTEIHMLTLMKIYQPFIEHMITFWLDYGREICFYKGVNVFQNRMTELSLPLCYGTCSDRGGEKEVEDLYELSLALYVQTYPVPNSFKNKDNILTIITGANQGGKSTFLRSFGIAQIMMQCGMPVPAAKFHSALYSKIHTHFTRKEDAMLSRGRLEEELKRMSGIISELVSDSLLLLNESFASTTEKEGSQIAYDIIMPCYQKGIEIMMVTHLHEFARKMYEKKLERCEFLVAERKENGDRTFRMLSGKPHYSSYGTDLYQYMIEEKNE